MNTPLLSVIIPLYNKAAQMRKALDSVLSQTFTDSEIIIINDGSKDNSLSIVQEYQQKCDRIVLIDQENRGASAARNRGIEAALGKYIIMMDADDTIEPNMHEIMISNALKYDVDLVVCNFNVVYHKQNPVAEKYNYICDTRLERDYIEQEVIPNCIGFKNNARPITLHVTLLIKKELLDKNNIRYNIEYKKEEDKPVIMQCLKYAQSVCFVKDCLYNYIKQPGSLISQYSPRFDNIMRTLKSYEENFSDILDFKSELWAKYYIKFFEESIGYVLIHKGNISNVKEEIMHIIDHPKSKSMFMLLSSDDYIKNMYETDNTKAIYKFYMRKFAKLRLKISVRDFLRKFRK